MICHKPVIPGEMFVEAKGRQFHESCIPASLVSALKFVGYEPTRKGV